MVVTSHPLVRFDRYGALEVAMSDATVKLARTWSGIGIGAQSEQWNIAIDRTVVGSIANKETVEVSVEPGHRTLRLGAGRQERRAVLRCGAG